MGRNILLSVTGLTPQVVTETLYHLVVVEKIKVDEIKIITTSVGKKVMESNLLRAGGPYYKFCEDFDILPHKVKVEIIPIRDPEGGMLEDIRTKEENEAMARTIVEEVYKVTENPEDTLIASIAGGRKTMSAYLALALQLFGREQDRLTHVLVWPKDLEDDRNFYYPKPAVEIYRLSSGKEIAANEIRIDLAEIPVIRLRSILEENLASGITDYLELIELSQFKINELKGRISAEWDVKNENLTVSYGEKKYQIHLGGRLAAIYHYAIEHPEGMTKEEDTAQVLQKIYKNNYCKKDYSSSDYAKEWDFEEIPKQVSEINRKLRDKLPRPIAKLLELQSEISRDATVYRLAFDVSIKED